MNNYEAIKKMSLEEMGATFYMFIKPFMDAFEISEEQKEKARDSIKAFLQAECGKKK